MESHAIRTCALEKTRKAPARMGWHLMSHTPLSQWLQDGNQGGRERACKGPVFSALRLAKSNRISLEVDILKGQSSVLEPATRVHGDMKTQLHPLRLDLKQLQAALKLHIGDLRFPAWLILGDADSSNRIGRNHAHARSLGQHHLKGLHILQGIVLAADPMPRLAAQAPANEFLPVGKLDLRGVVQIFQRQPVADMAPGAEVAFQGGSSLAMEMQPSLNPTPTLIFLGLRRSAFERLGKGRLSPQNLSLGCLDLALSTQACRCSHPFPSRQFPFQKPKWRVRAGVKRSHKASVTL